MKRAAIYIRTSSEKQAEKSSPEIQESDCRQYITDNGYALIDIYSDTKKYREGNKLVEPSGTKPNRPELKRMLADAQQGRFDVIVAWREDRLYRSFDAMLPVLNLVQKDMCDIELVRENFDKSIAWVKCGVAEMELSAKSDRFKMGVRGRLEKGKPLNHHPPFGYIKNTEGDYIINEVEAEWIRIIFQWYADGVSVGQIRKRLISGGAQQRSDKIKIPWHKSVIYKYINAEFYWTGEQKVNWDNEIYTIPIPPIIDPQLVDVVKKRLNNYKNYPSGNNKNHALATGLVYCTHCGVRMGIRTLSNGYLKEGATKPKKWVYYACNNFGGGMNGVDCAKRLNIEKLDAELWDRVWGVLSDPERLENAINKAITRLQSQEIDAHKECERLEKELLIIAEKRQQLISYVLDKKITESEFDHQINLFKQQQDEKKYELSQKRLMVDNQADNLIKYAEQYRQQVISGLDIINQEPVFDYQASVQLEFKRKTIQNLVKRIEVNKDKKFTIQTRIDLPVNINYPPTRRR